MMTNEEKIKKERRLRTVPVTVRKTFYYPFSAVRLPTCNLRNFIKLPIRQIQR